MASRKEGKELLERINASLRGEKEILLYIHLPFCSSECVFCNAFPQKSSQGIREKYTASLLKEIEIYARSGIFKARKAKCLYFGGGTPTAFAGRDIQSILSAIQSHVDLSEDCNITSEAHPKDLIKNDRMEELSDLGIGRISIGCQTFDPRVLELCKRSNPESQVRQVIRSAKELGLATNIDMMIGLPGQTLDGVKRDLDTLSEIAPDSIEYMRHEIVNPLAIALYQSNPDLLVGNDELFWMAYHTQQWMEEKGYEQNGRFTGEKQFPYRYNWLKEMPFIALGSRSRSSTKTLCYDKHEDLSLYLQLIDRGVAPIARYMVFNKREQMYRSLFLNIQVKRGLDLEAFTTRFGENALEVFATLLERLTEFGCVTADDSSLKLERYGRYFVEDVCCFIIDNALEEGGYDAGLKRVPHSSGAYFNTASSRLHIEQAGSE
jgi:oxygen-independent coproporphyrinogen-3 oxidase